MTSSNLDISGYTYVRNLGEMDYPAKESIESHLDLCDEVVVVNASTPPDTASAVMLRDLQQTYGSDRLRVVDVDVDWDAPNHGLFDGQLKALAREQAKCPWVCQFDCDEVIDVQDVAKVRATISDLSQVDDPEVVGKPVLALPVVEFWGSEGRVRIDVNPWKWRISKNLPDLTHGVPVTHRRVSKDGTLFAMPGTDGCDMISRETGQPVPVLNFMTQQTDQLRQSALYNEHAAAGYEGWLNMVTQSLPTWWHYSWWSAERKIKQYQVWWADFWKSMYGPEFVPGDNPFFPGRKLSEVSPEEIHDMAVNLEVNTGGWVFHTPWDQKRRCHVYLERPGPARMTEWCDRHKTPGV